MKYVKTEPIGKGEYELESITIDAKCFQCGRQISFSDAQEPWKEEDGLLVCPMSCSFCGADYGFHIHTPILFNTGR